MTQAAPSCLVIGASGLIGRHLCRALRERHPAARVVGTCHGRPGPGLVPYDLLEGPWPDTDLEGPGVLFLCGAVSRLSEVFEQPGRARAINVDASLRAIQEGRRRGFRCVFLSSEKVYGAGPRPAPEAQAGSPPTRYGQLKWDLERQLAEAHPDALVVRPARVYGTDGQDGLLQQMVLGLGRGETLACAPDLVFQPTHAADLANGILDLVACAASGPWNLAAPAAWSRFDLAVAVCRRLALPEHRVRAVALAELGLKEPMPADERLDISKFMGQCPRSFMSLEASLAELAS